MKLTIKYKGKSLESGETIHIPLQETDRFGNLIDHSNLSFCIEIVYYTTYENESWQTEPYKVSVMEAHPVYDLTHINDWRK